MGNGECKTCKTSAVFCFGSFRRVHSKFKLAFKKKSRLEEGRAQVVSY